MNRRFVRDWTSNEMRTPGRDRWLLSYADFMTLLLALFVVLYASAQVDIDEEHSLFAGLQAAFVFDENSPSPVQFESIPVELQPSTESVASVISARAQLEEDISRELESQRLRLGEDHGASLVQSERGLILTLASAEFFPAGGVEIPEERRAVLGAIAPLIAATSSSLQFEGHTDDQPIRSDQFPSNWELSAARASAVARFFIEDHSIDPKRIATIGYAEFRPIAANDVPANRALNRRVELVILEDGILTPLPGNQTKTSELDQILNGLPPIPTRADESLKPKDLGPPPEDIPLP